MNTFDLHVFACNFQDIQYFDNMSWHCFKPDLLSDKSTISSAYNKMHSEVLPILTGCVALLLKACTRSSI